MCVYIYTYTLLYIVCVFYIIYYLYKVCPVCAFTGMCIHTYIHIYIQTLTYVGDGHARIQYITNQQILQNIGLVVDALRGSAPA